MAHGLHVSSASTAIVLSAYFGAYAIMRLPGGGFGRLPVRPRVGNGLIRTSLILAPHRQTYCFPDLIGLFNESFFSSVAVS